MEYIITSLIRTSSLNMRASFAVFAIMCVAGVAHGREMPTGRRLTSSSQSYWATIATSPSVWSTTIVTKNWYLADTNGYSSIQNQYVASGFLKVSQDIPRTSQPLSVWYTITATKKSPDYIEVSIDLTSNDRVVGRLTGQTSLLAGTAISGHAVVHFV
jgi:hypothetical protein